MDYSKNMDLYVFPFQIAEKKKVRTIITYKDTKEGQEFRAYHENLLKKLEKKQSSSLSYAYKKGISTKDAIVGHKNSNLFIKMDIKSFFESITYESFLENTKEYLNPTKDLVNCFYKGHVSLGFVTSPKISDLFLYGFDKKIEDYLKHNPNLCFSRYCDDILISTRSEDFGTLHTFKSYIESCLEKIGLSINKKKVFEYDFSKHNAMTFLGLNLVPQENNEAIITIAKPFIVDTLYLIEDYYKLLERIDSMRPDIHERWQKMKKEECDEDFIKESKSIYFNWRALKIKKVEDRGIILSRIAYIKTNSEYSYARFLKKYSNRFDKPLEELTKWH